MKRKKGESHAAPQTAGAENPQPAAGGPQLPGLREASELGARPPDVPVRGMRGGLDEGSRDPTAEELLAELCPPSIELEEVRKFLCLLSKGIVNTCNKCGEDFWFVRMPVSGADAPFTVRLENHAAVHPSCLTLSGFKARRID